MNVQRDVILVAEDDPSLRRILRMQLEAAGYAVLEAADGVEAMKILKTNQPDLVLLDVMMPNMDGNETCMRIRADRRLRHLPIIFLTAKSTSDSKIEGLHKGANDYLTKPYDRRELLLRIKNLIGWSRAQQYRNPLTGLPGNPAIEAEVEERLEQGNPFAFLYVDMDDFKAYNDFYSYRAGDEVIRLLSRILSSTVEKKGNEDDLVGHVGGDDFVVITTPDRADIIANDVVTRFDDQILEYYQPREKKRGYVEIENRQGRMERFSLVSVTIAVAASDECRIQHVAQLNDVIADLKRRGKKIRGSVVVWERRQASGGGAARTGSDG